ncbi:MAG: LacI family DNA-binding transcriptional regulator [Silicimonas sp.]
MTTDPEDNRQAPRKVRLIEVAREAGVSRSAVSLALRGHPSIPERTRNRIQEAVQSLGYVYNRGAASLRTASTQTVGIIVHDVTNPYFAEIVAAVQDEMTRHGRVVLFGNTQESTTRQAEFIETFREHNVDGLIVCPAAGTRPETVADVQRSGLPLVIFSRDIPEANVDYVGGANLEGMQKATAHLISAGHRRIAMVGANMEIATGRDRLAGYRAALAEADIPEDPALVIEGPATRDFGLQAIKSLMAQDPNLTACVCFNDVLAFGVMLGLRNDGKEAGRDFSVVGFDDVAEATLWRPALTSLGFSHEELGRQVAELLLRRVGQPDAPPKRVVMDFELRSRDTVRIIPSEATAPI